MDKTYLERELSYLELYNLGSLESIVGNLGVGKSRENLGSLENLQNWDSLPRSENLECLEALECIEYTESTKSRGITD